MKCCRFSEEQNISMLKEQDAGDLIPIISTRRDVSFPLNRSRRRTQNEAQAFLASARSF